MFFIILGNSVVARVISQKTIAIHIKRPDSFVRNVFVLLVEIEKGEALSDLPSRLLDCC